MAGVTFSDTDVLIWQQRYNSGYTPGVTGLPDTYAASKTRADDFLNDIVTDYVTVDINVTDPKTSNNKGAGTYLMSCSLHYLITGTSTYGTKVHDNIVNQVQESIVQFWNGTGWNWPYANGSNKISFNSTWVTRVFMAYDYTKDLYTSEEKTIIETWFGYAAEFYRYSIHNILQYRFPNRLSRDYSVLGADALTGASYSPPKYTHWDSNGDTVNEIRTVAGWYKNSYAMQVAFFGLWGIYANDATLIDQAKIWCEEYLQFAVYPDGTTGEWQRNGNYLVQSGSGVYDTNQGAMLYGIIVLESVLLIADALSRTGDNSLYTYSNSFGLYDSTDGSTEKNIRLVIDTLIEQCTATYGGATGQKFCLVNDPIVSSATLIDTYDIIGSNNYYKTPEIGFGIANRYYQSQEIEDIYLRNNANQKQWTGTNVYFPVGEPGFSFMLANGILPAADFQTWELEPIVTGQPIANAGSDQSVYVATTTLDGTGSYDNGGTIVSYLWEQVSGPNTANILTPSGSSSIVNGLIVGDYVFRLTITDNDSLTDTDEVTITVNPVISTTKANARVLL